MTAIASTTGPTPGPLVALVGATSAAIPPTTQAFRQEFPEARLWNLLDDRLLSEAIDAGGLTEDLRERMSRLIRYAIDGGAAGVLLTCSMYGPIAHAADAETDVPVHAADDAAFDEATRAGYERLVLLSSLPAALADARNRLAAFQSERRGGPEVRGILAPGAFEASDAGDTASLVASLASAVRDAASEGWIPDGVLLSQYSLAPAADQLAALVGLPVLSGPGIAARELRHQLLAEAG